MFITYLKRPNVVVVVYIVKATKHQRHSEAAETIVNMRLYRYAFMDHACTSGATVCNLASPVLFILTSHVETFIDASGVRNHNLQLASRVPLGLRQSKFCSFYVIEILRNIFIKLVNLIHSYIHI